MGLPAQRKCSASTVYVYYNGFFLQDCGRGGANGLTYVLLNRLRKAVEDAANLTPEAVAAKMSPEEKLRLSRVRNIGIAVCSFPQTFCLYVPLLGDIE